MLRERSYLAAAPMESGDSQHRLMTGFQITVDCHDPGLLARFSATALWHDLQEPPDGSATWADYWRKRGLPEDEIGHDSIVDAAGAGPRL